MSSAKSIEERYFQDFGNKDYDDAMVYLWEKHCQYPVRYTWPPSLQDVKDEIKSIQDGRAYDNERR